PALDAGTWVLCDRYVYSSYAFFAARGVDVDFIRRINHDVPRPDLTLFIDVPIDVALERIRARDGSILKVEERSPEFMVRVRAAFLDCADETFVMLDGRDHPLTLAQRIADLLVTRWPSELGALVA